MKILYFDCMMGGAGDMIMAALYELIENKNEFLDAMNNAGFDSVVVKPVTSIKKGISGTHMNVLIENKEELEHISEHSHGHDHGHTMEQIIKFIDNLNIKQSVKDDVKNIYKKIAEAESKVHGKTVEQIHLHEVGMMDAIVDITGCCLLFDMLNADKIVVSPIATGYGTVKCMHGILSVPAPATSILLNNVPTYAGYVEGELCTPTAAAILTYFAEEFSNQPLMKVSSIGYGMGTKDFDICNCIRVFCGNTEENADKICILSCNVDDMTGEELGFAMEKIMECGALDVYSQNIQMKKGRPANMISVMCRPDEKQKYTRLLFENTSTIGVRENYYNRTVMDRQFIKKFTKYGEVIVKRCSYDGIVKEKIEYEDIRKIAKANDTSIKEIRNNIEKGL